MRHIKGYNNMSKEKLSSVFSRSKSAKSKKNFDNTKIKNIRKDFNKLRDRFLKLKKKKKKRNQIKSL